jgi:hypothetical protein
MSTRILAWSLGFLCGLSPIAAAQATAASPATANSTYDAVIEGMSCRQHGTGRLDCEYRVGEALRFVITGVGQDDALVNFLKVDSAAGYVAGFSALHLCVVVKPAVADSAARLAFVSPRDGRVYRVWQHCRQPPRR